MKFDYPVLILLGIAAIALIAFMIWRNLIDVNDNDPELTDELEKVEKTEPKDKHSQ